MNKKKVIITLCAVAAVGVIASRFLGGDKEEAYEVRPTVVAEQPKKESIVLYTETTGLVEPQSQAAVKPKMSGEVLEVFFQAGDRVTVGQVLCRIDSDALTSLKLQMDAQAVNLKNATNTANRTRALFADGFVSQEAMEQAEDGLQGAQIAYDAAKNQYDLQVEYTTVVSPLNGVIEARSVDPHDHISPSDVICTISGQDALQVKFGITEKVHKNLKIGDAISIEKNGVEYQGRVAEIGEMVNASSGLYDVRATVPASDGLTNGTRVKLTVEMSRADGVLTVPLDAVNYDNGIPFVFCYADGTAYKTEIESGLYDDERMAVVSGLTEDSVVITSWSNELVDQGSVILKNTDAAEAENGAADMAESADGQVKAE